MAEATALLRNRSFCQLWVAQFSAVTVIYSLGLAGATLVEEWTHSSTQTGMIILSAILPAFLASLVAGAVVDRWGWKQVLVASHLARGLAALAFWGGTGLLPPGQALVLVYAVNVAGTAFTQFAMPAELALLPDLVGRSRLLSANALFQFSMLAAEGLGIVVLSPLVIKLYGAPAVGLVGAGLCLVAMALATALPSDRSQTKLAESEGSAWSRTKDDLLAGWRTISRDRLLSLVTVQATVAAALLLVLLSLVPGLVSRHLGLGVEDAPFLLLPGGLGFVLGALLVGHWEDRLSRPKWITVGFAGLGLSIGLLSAASGEAGRVWLILPVILGLGATLAMIILPARVVLQERPPPEMRGRVIAAQLALANAAAVLPLLVGGSLADQLGIRPVMGLLSLVALGTAAIGLYWVRRGKGERALT
jgi:DHA3 family macrolide efflux protein-like MFS transporter